MPPQTLVKRVERLEERVTILERLPEHVDELASQLLQLRTEMRSELSAVRDEINSGLAAVRAEMRAGDEETRRTLGEEIRAGDAEIIRHARMLHEDLISRWPLMQEGNPRRGKRR
jgi:archaellum component FlaC